jgi:hypothetical protein
MALGLSVIKMTGIVENSRTREIEKFRIEPQINIPTDIMTRMRKKILNKAGMRVVKIP